MDSASWIVFGFIGAAALVILRLFKTDQQDHRGRPSEKYAGRSGYQHHLSQRD